MRADERDKVLSGLAPILQRAIADCSIGGGLSSLLELQQALHITLFHLQHAISAAHDPSSGTTILIHEDDVWKVNRYRELNSRKEHSGIS